MIAADSGHLLGSLIRFLLSVSFLVIALARLSARKRLIETLKSRSATSAESAVTIEPKGPFEPSALGYLLRRGAVVEVPKQGDYYLDEKKYTELCAHERKIRLIAFALLILLAVVLFALI